MRLIQTAILVQVVIFPLAASELLPDPLTLVKHQSLLELRVEQVEQLQTLATEGLTRLETLREELRQAEQALDAKLQEQPLDRVGSHAAGIALLDAERAVKLHMLDILLRSQAMLDQEQRARMLQRLKEAGAAVDNADMQRSIARIKHLAEQFQARGGDVSGLPQCLQVITQAAQQGKDQEAAILIRETIDDLERRLQNAPME